ncbi:MAG: DUF928 domain-containing protein [Cyanobacteria bacterium J06592_8]
MAFKFLRAVKVLPVFLSIELLFALNIIHPIYAQPLPTNEEAVEEIIRTRVNFQPSSDGVPDGSASGGSRGNLRLLLPETNKSWLTTKEKPTFFIYVGKKNIQEVQLILKDQETQDIIYENSIELNGDTGIFPIPLPDDAPSLEVGKIYELAFIYGVENANGMIQRVELNPTVSNQLENADPLDQAVLYAENGIWFDTLEIMAELKRSQPDNEIYAAEWKRLLESESVGLEDMVTKPLVE